MTKNANDVMNVVVNGEPIRCKKCNKPEIFCVQNISGDFFVGPMCDCFPDLKKKYASKAAAINALLTRSYKIKND